METGMKIAYVGIDLLYGALECLKNNNCEILKIFTCKTNNVTEFNTKIIEFAKTNEVPYTLERITIKDIEEMLDKGCDALICGAYYYRIPTNHSLAMVNIHPSLLPMGRGSWPMPLIILNGHKQGGVTLHKMVEAFDEGDIISQQSFEISKQETLQTYMDKVDERLSDMINDLISNFDNLYKNALPQGEGEYWEEPKKADATIKSTDGFDKVDLILRAFYGYECYYTDGNKMYEILKGTAVKNKGNKKWYLPVNGGYVEADSVKEVVENGD